MKIQSRLGVSIACQCKPKYYDTAQDFPTIGITKTLYVDESTGDIYIWNGTGYITSDVKISATQNNVLTVVADTDGLQVDTTAAPTYSTFALAQADAGLLVGDLYALTVNNLEGVPSNGSAGPFFRKA